MRRIGSAILTALMAGLLLACPPPQAILLFNNTGERLTIEHQGRPTAWGTRQTLRIGEGKDAVDWDELTWRPVAEGGADVPVLTVVRSGKRLEYVLLQASLPSDFVDLTGRVVTARFQLESDGKMYAIRKNDSFPAKEIPEQPEGFPIEPEPAG